MEDLTARLPERLSPSRLKDFKQCPRLFYYKTIEKMKTPATMATTKGTLAHYAFEKIFDHPPEERTSIIAVPYVRAHWEELKEKDKEVGHYQVIIDLGEEMVEQMLEEAEQLVTNWFSVERPWRFEPHGREAWVRGEIGGCAMHGIIDRTDVIESPEKTRVYISDYKGLALDTALPTPSGWTSMGDIRVGDILFGSDGNPCEVIIKSPVFNRSCYRITFDDGSEIVCDNEHLWEVHTGGVHNLVSEVLSMDDLSNRWNEGERPFLIPNGAPLHTAEAELPIDPYLLGCWLGDGTTKSGEITVGHEDISHFVGSLVNQGENVIERVSSSRSTVHSVSIGKPQPEACSYEHDFSGINAVRSKRRGCHICKESNSGFRFNASLGFRLSDMGVLHNKHVPGVYLRGSVEQRLALLQGLMDTDGHWNPVRRQAIFVNTNKQIIDSVYELVCSLGARATIFQVEPKKTTHAVAYMIMFTPNNFNPFRLWRKASLVRLQSSRSWRRAIRNIEAVASVPTQCIQVNSPNSLYLAGKQMVPTHNTGKVPNDRYVHDAFFAMNIYAELFAQQDDMVADELRLVYVKNGLRSDIKTQLVTPETRAQTRDEVTGLWNDITACAQSTEFAPRTSVLCGWCHFQSICPAFATPAPF